MNLMELTWIYATLISQLLQDLDFDLVSKSYQRIFLFHELT